MARLSTSELELAPLDADALASPPASDGLAPPSASTPAALNAALDRAPPPASDSLNAGPNAALDRAPSTSALLPPSAKEHSSRSWSCPPSLNRRRCLVGWLVALALAGVVAGVVAGAVVGTEDARSRLYRVVAACPRSGGCVVTVPAGENALESSGRESTAPAAAFDTLNFYGPRSDLSLVGASAGTPSTLVFQGRMGGLQFTNMARLTLADLVIDMRRPPHTTGRAVAVGAATTTISVLCAGAALSSSSSSSSSDCWPPPPPGSTPASAYGWLYEVLAAFEYDEARTRPAVGGLDYYAPLDRPLSASWSEDAATGTRYLTVAGLGGSDGVVEGRTYVLRHCTYRANALSFVNVHTVTLRNVTVYASPGMAVYMWGCSDITVDGLRVVRAAGRTLSAAADALHLVDSSGTVTVRNCALEGQGDDGINIHSAFKQVLAVEGADRTTVVLGDVDRSTGDWAWATRTQAGTPLEFRARDTYEVLHTAVVAAGASMHSGGSGSSVTLDGRVTLTAPLPANVPVNALVAATDRLPTSVQVVHSVFAENRGRCVLVKAPNALVAHNTFSGCWGPGVVVNTDGCYWLEGYVVRGLRVTNCTFQGNAYAAPSVYALGLPLGDIIVEACVPTAFDDAGTPLRASGAEVPAGHTPHANVTIDGNRFQLAYGQRAAALWAVDGVVFSGNTIEATSAASLPALFTSGCTGVAA